ncbi:MAG: lysophospholipid acyltransferase family protein [Deltaproteobacteria bacterium]|nr:lysophospholipid acyltransferase family protein [Deltaproteobacteria bacterium]
MKSAGVDAFGKDPAVLLALRPRLDALLDRWFRVIVEGAAHLPANGRVILVANHGGALPWDALVLIAALSRGDPGREVRPLVEDAVMTAPFLGTFLNRLGCVRASQDNATRLLGHGEACLVFPEGEQGLGKNYRRRHQLQRFGRGGFVRLAVRTDTPLVPVAVVGSEDTAPLLARVDAFSAFFAEVLPWLPVTPTFPLLGPLGLLPLPARWRIRIGEPVDARAEVKDEADAVAVNALATSVRDRLQRDVTDLVAQRGGAFF